MTKKPKFKYTEEQLEYFRLQGMKGGAVGASKFTREQMAARMARVRAYKKARKLVHG